MGTAAIDVVENRTSTHRDISIALDKARLDIGGVTFATAVDVTIHFAALPRCTDGAAADSDVGIARHLRQLATAIDTLFHCAVGHDDGGASRYLSLLHICSTFTSTEDITCDVGWSYGFGNTIG